MKGAEQIPVRVASRHAQTRDICSLELVREAGHALPAFTAGAHIDLHLPNGLVRQYSLCNPPGQTQRYQIAVLRDPASRGGPQGFMDAVLNAGRAAGWPQQCMHSEYFAAAPVDHPHDGGFELELCSSGRVIPVRADQSALNALLAAGLDIPMACEQGVCGTCLTGVKSGTPDHRDQYLTDEERAANTQFLPCCSRAQTARLVLDL